MIRHVVFQPSNRSIGVPDGTLVSDAAKQAGVWIDSPCGGNGTCKKCGVTLIAGGKEETVLACQTKVETDCVVRTTSESEIVTLSSASARAVTFAPYTRTAAYPDGACFAAFDLGTTTIVCYLLDAKSGRQIAVHGMQNPQTAFGADVIARAAYALENSANPLRVSAASGLNRLLGKVCRIAGKTPEQVVLISIVGNTVMHHLLLGYPVDALARAPYEPYRSEKLILPAKELGLAAHESCEVLLPPVIGGYVGADTVACMSATAFDTLLEPTFLIDIGTNGELALTDGQKIAVCATAAGPAFEGANISCGMRAIDGAIEHFSLEDGRLLCRVIGGGEPAGICGSGLIELVSLLCQTGAVDETGLLRQNGCLSDRVVQTQTGVRAFRIAGEGNDALLLTQKDIRELQLAKAAMRAGVETLIGVLSLRPEQIKEVLLAGAFGAHLSPDALFGVGLLPGGLSGRVKSIGNAAGEGAKAYLRNFELFQQSEALAESADYIELTDSDTFSECFIEAISFPEKGEN